jgi:prepilin-type N-terminal cleavage/methylation domain-containing protein/prepilin-type processing-associated H-X9-DG protein
MSHQRAFTLLELLVVLALIAIIVGITVPSYHAIRNASYVAKDLAHIRNLQVAHFAYLADRNGKFIDAGLSHGGLANESVAWINTLQKYYDNALVLHSPLDTSKHWPKAEGGEGIPVPPSTDRYRRTSYGLNNYLTQYSPTAAIDPTQAATRIGRVRSPAATAHFLIMAYEGTFAGADHTHVETWEVSPNAAFEAGNHVQTNAVSGPERDWTSRSNYGFLDGHAETLPFSGVYVDADTNRFNPELSSQFAVTLDMAP